MSTKIKYFSLLSTISRGERRGAAAGGRERGGAGSLDEARPPGGGAQQPHPARPLPLPGAPPRPGHQLAAAARPTDLS